MATTSKTSPKTKKRAVSKATTKRAPAKKTTVRTTKTKAPEMKSFRLSKNQRPLMSMQPSRDTLYWVVFGVIAIGIALWLTKLQADINTIYDRIDATTATGMEMPVNRHTTPHH